MTAPGAARGEESEWIALLDAAPSASELAPGVTAADFRAFHVRPATPSGAVFAGDVAYGTAGAGGRELVLHVYRRADSAERCPAVVLVHGGGWSGGHPFHQVRYAAGLAAAGYVTAMVSYRLVPEARWPAPLEDVKAATRWIRANADRLGADAGRVALAGDSAGGHLALMGALTPGRWEGEGGNAGVRSDADALVLWYPIVDLTVGPRHPALHELAVPFLGDDAPGLLAEASPVAHLSTGGPPTLLQVGEDDDLTTAASIQDLARRLTVRGTDVRVHTEPGAGHAFDLVPSRWPASLGRVVAFLDEVWGGGRA